MAAGAHGCGTPAWGAMAGWAQAGIRQGADSGGQLMAGGGEWWLRASGGQWPWGEAEGSEGRTRWRPPGQMTGQYPRQSPPYSRDRT